MIVILRDYNLLTNFVYKYYDQNITTFLLGTHRKSEIASKISEEIV